MNQICQTICNWFSPESSSSLAVKELAHAKRELLAHQTQYEFSKYMVQYNTERIKRLARYELPIKREV